MCIVCSHLYFLYSSFFREFLWHIVLWNMNNFQTDLFDSPWDITIQCQSDLGIMAMKKYRDFQDWSLSIRYNLVLYPEYLLFGLGLTFQPGIKPEYYKCCSRVATWGQSILGSNDNERMTLHSSELQNWSLTIECSLMSYLRHNLHWKKYL